MPENRVESVRKQGSSARMSPDATVKVSKRRTVVLAVLFRIESAQNGVDRPCSRVLRGEIGSTLPRFSLSSPRTVRFGRPSASEATRKRSRNAPHSRLNCLPRRKAVQQPRHSCLPRILEESKPAASGIAYSQERSPASKDHAILFEGNTPHHKESRVSADRLPLRRRGPQKQRPHLSQAAARLHESAVLHGRDFGRHLCGTVRCNGSRIGA